MKRDEIKQEMLEAYQEELDVLLEDIEDAEDFIDFERSILKHRDRQSKAEAEVVQKHKSFFP